ncbi:hypothetical protein KBD61_00685, partial [Patescibacteria group bacterium]|nr:hypothetical protein [Patescibacteria group bacterium]
AMRASGVGHDPKSAGKSLCGYISSMQASSNLTFHPQGMQQCEYRGSYPDLHHVIALMQKENPSIKISLFLPKDLEDVFLGLSEEKAFDIIGYIPEPESIDQVDYEVLTEVVKYLLNNAKPLSPDASLRVPNFEEKISFNQLSKEVGALLNTASFQASVLYDFFQNNSAYSRQNLRDIFSDIYNSGLQEFNGTITNRSDLIFFYILKMSSPKDSKSAQDATLVLMSYFFESCDIFEEPK